MLIREGGMPAEEMWDSFFTPSATLQAMGLGTNCKKVVDFGCGYGTFTLPAAQITAGTVFAIDLDASYIAICERKVNEAGLMNIICEQRDFVRYGVNLADNLVDYAMLFNILHAENPIAILCEAYRILAPQGKVGVMHWNYDSTTPRGPSMAIRPRPDECQAWIKQAGFELIEPHINLPPYHYGIVGQKQNYNTKENKDEHSTDNQ